MNLLTPNRPDRSQPIPWRELPFGSNPATEAYRNDSLACLSSRFATSGFARQPDVVHRLSSQP